MSVTLYEPALARLLDSSTGDVGRFVQTKTETIATQLGRNAADYFGSAPTLAVGMESDVQVEMEGSTGVVSITPSGSGRKWNRLFSMTRENTWVNGPQAVLEANRF